MENKEQKEKQTGGKKDENEDRIDQNTTSAQVDDGYDVRRVIAHLLFGSVYFLYIEK